MSHITATMSARVLEYLAQGIIEGEFAPGQRLTEEDIAGRLGISRSPVREAFRLLEHDGLAVGVPRKGFFVRRLDAGDAAALYQLQAAVAGLLGRLAAEHCGPDDIESLEGIVRSMAAAAESRDAHKFLELFLELTHGLTQAAGNPWLEQALTTWEKPILRYAYFALSMPGYMEEALARYQAVLAAVKQRDGHRAEEILRLSIEGAGQRIAEVLRAAVPTAGRWPA